MDPDRLGRALRSSDADVVFAALLETQMFAAISEGRLAPLQPEVVRLANDREASRKVRMIALKTLPVFGPSDDRGRDAALTALADADPGIRQSGLEALIPMRNLRPEDLDAIRALAEDADTDVARWSEIALRNIAQLGRSGR